MANLAGPVKLPPDFDLQGQNAATEWKFWKTSFEDYMIATGQHKSAQKIKLSILRFPQSVPRPFFTMIHEHLQEFHENNENTSSNNSAKSDEEIAKQEDEVEVLSDVVTTAAHQEWSQQHMCRFLLCDIGEINSLKKICDVHVKNNSIHVKEDICQHPIVFVACIGNVKETKLIHGKYWYEIEDSTGTIDCSSETLQEDMNDETYSRYHSNFRKIEKDFVADSSKTEDAFSLNLSGSLWLLSRRLKEIRQADVRLKPYCEIVGLKVMVLGKLMNNKNGKKYIELRKCLVLDKKLEEWIRLNLEKGRWYEDLLEKLNRAKLGT